MKENYPDFVIIGSMKSASTSLAGLLAEHPEVFVTDPKEPGYFSRDERYYESDKTYFDLYKDALPPQVAGEASTCYTRYPLYAETAKRLYACNPECKLIYIMRDPVKRAFSHYEHRMAERISAGKEHTILPYREAVTDMKEILASSNYMLQISRYLEYFPLENFHFIILEELLSNQDEVLSGLCQFLKISHIDNNEWKLKKSNERGTKITLRKSSGMIESASSLIPAVIKNHIPRAVKQKGRATIQKGLQRFLGKSSVNTLDKMLEKATAEENLMVYKELESSIQKLEDFLQKDLKGWKRY